MPGQTEVLSFLHLLRPYRCDFRKVRIGSLGDGGYVMPDDCDGVSAVLSLGVGSEVSFAAHFARRGVPVYQYDPTVGGPPIAHENFHFNAVAWGATDRHGVASLGTMIRSHGLNANNDAILKFDIEGGEWDAMSTVMPDQLKYFRIIVCELHALHALSDLTYLRTRNDTVVHLHANNCCGISLVVGVPVPAVVELTLLRNDRSGFSPSDEPIPGPLDYPSMDDRPDLVLRPFG